MNKLPWHVLHVLSNQEKRVAQHLAARNVEHYLPLYTERAHWADRTVIAERPLFSGYVFVQVSAQTRLAVISTPGVLRLLGIDERSTVSCEDVDRIRDGLASGLILRPHPSFTVGTRVRVTAGIFASAEGVVTELRRQCRVVITLAAVQQQFSLEVNLNELEVLDKRLSEPEPRPLAIVRDRSVTNLVHPSLLLSCPGERFNDTLIQMNHPRLRSAKKVKKGVTAA